MAECVGEELLSEVDAGAMTRWPHSGFSLDTSVHVGATDRDALRRLLMYIFRPPFASARLTYKPGARTAIYKIHTNEHLHHRTRANFVALPPVRLLLRLLALTPPAGLKTVRYVGAYAGSLRARGGSDPPPPTPLEPNEAAPPHAGSSAWARLLHRVFQLSPLLCECGSILRLKSFVTADTELVRLLHYLDLPTELPTTARSRAPPLVEQPELLDDFDQAASM